MGPITFNIIFRIYMEIILIFLKYRYFKINVMEIIIN